MTRRSYHLHSLLAEELETETTGYRVLNTLSLTLDSKRPRPGPGERRQGPAWVSGRVVDCEVLGSPATTAQVHPRLLTAALMAAAVKAGASLLKGKVTGARLSSGVVTGLQLSSGQIVEADIVVLCMGAWTGRGLEMFGLSSSLVGGHRAHSITIKLPNPAQSGIDNTALFLSSPGEPELYPRPDGTLYMCGGCRTEQLPLPEDPAEVKVDLEACREIKTLAGQISDRLGEAESYDSSACYLPHSQDGTPIIGKISKVTSTDFWTRPLSQMYILLFPLQVEGLYVGAGHSCWGILQGPATGEALAQLILTGHTEHVALDNFSPDRFNI